jgi:CheY-like chemotaxis protein
MAELTKQEDKDRQAKVSSILYSVEESIKKGNLDDALDKIRKVYQYDIKNMYARAFEERILVMIVERGEKELAEKYEQRHLQLKEEIDKRAQIEVNKKLKDYHRQWEEETAIREAKEREERELEQRARQVSLEEQKIEDEKDYAALKDENRDRIEQWERKMKDEVQAAIEAERARLNEELAARLAEIAASTPAADVQAGVQGGSLKELQEQMEAEYAAKLHTSKEQMEQDVQTKLEAARVSLHEEAFEKVRLENAAVQDELRRQFEQEKANWVEQEQVKTKERLREAYKAILVMMDMSMPSEHLESLLLSLRTILDVSDSEHSDMLRSVQVNSYIDTLRAAWQKGKIVDEEKQLLAHLCELYGISQEEHENLTKQVKRQLGLPEEVASILAIDDSRDILVFVDHVLKKTYANIRIAGSVKEAVSKIGEEMPALILCDVMMPEIGGFAFFDLIQKGEYGEEIKNVPFIFMSGCSDEYMKKIAEDLGVNKYLAKPFSKETLVKTVKDMLEKN